MANQTDADKAAADKAAADKAAKKTEVTVTGRTAKGMAVTRVFSKEVHGADFMKEAKEAAEKFNGEVS